MASTRSTKKVRCHWVPDDDTEYARYHDLEWGRRVKDDSVFFEFLILESAQAGLSWATILKRRPGYRKAFANFDPEKIAQFKKRDEERLMHDAGIIRNRLKIKSTIENAKLFLTLQKEFGSFSKYVWGFVGGKTIFQSKKHEHRLTSPEGETLAKDLKRRGFKFFGPVIAYAFLQATGLINDHEPTCFRYQKK